MGAVTDATDTTAPRPDSQSGLSYGFDTSGTLNPIDGLYFKHKKGMYDVGADLETMVDGLAEMPLFFQPGTHWNYSLGIDVCGRLVEVLSGEPFDRFMHDHIFQPLGMHSTSFTLDASNRGLLCAMCASRPTAACLCSALCCDG
jgi:CubicO group peptidase (beta-lactamase class C family)